MSIKDEKVELVKRLIRANNYRQYDKTLEQCVELGININRIALTRFADKLELIDKAERSRAQRQQAERQQSNSSTSTPLAARDMTYEQVKQREAEITFELGALRIKENALLMELNSLSERLKDKH
ncbi:hypothetical protein [Alteromonas oceanisediminis]|uniref:hypothetical protein n=1 Tax=Alteromonas oceanisediminis TaxID=2836180 RepID=UPI001BDB5DB8|nr:hypothetical protein [Alteromonas oceanisediminis]MBT0586313.1 hypothetical protein [Alteromonas oceanisediminis]